MPRRYNPLVRHPLMGKGGAHQESRSATRVHAREVLLDEADEYMWERREADAIQHDKEPVPDGTGSSCIDDAQCAGPGNLLFARGRESTGQLACA